MPKRLTVLLALAALSMFLSGCGGQPAARSKATSKKVSAKNTVARKTAEPFVLPPSPPKVEQDAFASVDEAMAAVEELVKNPGEKQGQELMKVETWLQMQGTRITPQLAEKIKDQKEPLPTRITACRVLTRLGPAAATPVLMEATASEPKELRVKAIECLGRIKPTTSDIVDKVIVLVDDPDYEQRKAALGSLASIGKPAAKAKDRLMEILNDTQEDETIRSLAKKALKEVDPRTGLMNVK